MATVQKRLTIGLMANWAGSHGAAWRQDSVPPGAMLSFNFYRKIAETAERGRFDLLFLADHLAAGDPNVKPEDYERASDVVFFEPITLLSGLAAVTSHIGLTATMSTTFNEPYTVARMMASLDHLSGGRAGWNVVTTGREASAANFGVRHMRHDDRYLRATEFVEVVRKLWDSWEDDAFAYDKSTGRYLDHTKLHVPDHHGRFFSVKGPLNLARPPQGHPLIIQAGSSDPGLELAAATADIVFAIQHDLGSAQAYYQDLKARMRKYGRQPDTLKVMPGLIPFVGRTGAEAREKYEALQGLMELRAALATLSNLWGGIDYRNHDIDAPFDLAIDPEGNVTRQKTLLRIARREGLTIRELAFRAAGARGHRVLIGSAAEVADDIELWLDSDAADGFNLFPANLPDGVADFVDLVVPILQERGRLRRDYESRLLRENLGLPRPAWAGETVAAR